MGEERPGHPSTERVSVPQAADHLGTTVDAIRKRVQRDTIPYERDEQGRVWILLDTGRPRQDAPGQRQDTGQPQSDSTALISEMRDHLEDLRAQLEAERQAHAEARRLLMAALERIPPQLEPPREEAAQAPPQAERGPVVRFGEARPSEPPGAPENGADEQQGRGPIPEAPSPPGGTERPWWRRMFSG